MTRFWGTAILIGFTALSVFGFLAFMHDEHSHVLACMAGFNEGSLCPANPFDWVAFHLSFLKSFSMAVFAAVILGFVVVVWRASAIPFGADLNLARFLWQSTPTVPTFKFKTLQWLAMHIASPSF